MSKYSILKKICCASLLIILGIIMPACHRAPGVALPTNIPPGTTFPVSMSDDLGRQVQVAKTPQRIVSLAPSNTEIVFALGLGDRLVGDTEYCDYPPEAKLKEKVGGYADINVEKVLSLNPDLVLAEDIQKQDVIPALERVGITCYALVPHNLNEIMNSILVIGRLTGANTKAQEIVADMQSRIKKISDKTASLVDAKRPRVMYVIWHEPIMSVGVDTPINEMITLAGGVNIIKTATGFPTLSLEEVINANPQVIAANVEDYPGGDAPFQAILTEPRLKTVDAVANGKVYGITASLTNRPVPRIIDGLEWLAAIIHPELFPEYVQKYITKS
jgi:iron complex transport system substrate-binding protein